MLDRGGTGPPKLASSRNNTTKLQTCGPLDAFFLSSYSTYSKTRILSTTNFKADGIYSKEDRAFRCPHAKKINNKTKPKLPKLQVKRTS